jgi:hypothetical protein
MIKFTIVNESLQISRGTTIILLMPNLYIGADSLSLYENEPKIVLFNIAQSPSFLVFEGLLSDCTDSNGTPFTINSFLSFVASNFGNTVNSPSSDGTNGTTPYKLIATNSTNETNIKDTSGNLYSITAIGLTSSVTYLKLYNLDVVPDFVTDIPVLTIPVPANTQGAGVTIPFLYGINFSVGISFAITGLPADDDTTSVDAGSVIINLTYA